MIMQYMLFKYTAITILILWLISGLLFILFSLKKKKYLKQTAIILTVSGILLLAGFLAYLWYSLGRPPMKTLGETRLWYSLFMPVIGLIIYFKWRYNWFIIYSLIMAIVFLLLNILIPERLDEALMPALQSVWFVPHVIVYIFSYALLAAASLISVYSLYSIYLRKKKCDYLNISDNLVYLGFGFLTLGLLFGALWAKEAWGHYWTWDPKETWAFITWMGFLTYIHYRKYRSQHIKTAMWVLALSFVILIICWFGINYIPAAQNSVHVY